MTGNYYLCAWGTKGDCDMDAVSLECSMCKNYHGGKYYGEIMSGVCSHVVESVNHEIYSDHDDRY